MKNVLDKTVEKIITQFYLQIFLPKNRTVFEIME